MKNGNRGGSAFEYIMLIVIIAIVAFLGSYYYRTKVVQKGFQTSIDSLEQGQDLASQNFTEETNKISKIKLSGPMILAIACIVILMLILFSTFKAAKRAKRGLKDIGDDEDGQAMTEFVLSFPILLFITLCIMQLSLIYTARLVVNYSAFSAARAASVIIPISLSKQTSEDQNEPEGMVVYNNKKGKLDLIRNAARLTCMPISAGALTVMNNFSVTVVGHTYHPLQDVSSMLGTVLGAVTSVFTSIGTVFGSGDLGNYVNSAVQRYIYSYFFTQIELLDDNFEPITTDKTFTREVTTVRVKHAFYLAIPIANAFFGERWGWNLFDEMGLGNLGGGILSGLNLNQYNTEVSGGYVFKLKAECSMHVEMKAGH